MMFPGWQIGLDIQMEGVRAIAVQWHRQGWQLRHWWHFPFFSPVSGDDIFSQPDALFKVLDGWRKQLPNRHSLRVSFPAQRTSQRKISPPDSDICEKVREDYIAYTAAQQLQVPVSQICWDYLEQGGALNVSTARQHDMDTLLACLKSVQLVPNAVTPCDKVLQALPETCYPPGCDYLVHEEPDYWLWASCRTAGYSGWQNKQQIPCLSGLCDYLGSPAENMAFSSGCIEDRPALTVQSLDVWPLLIRQYPPLPQQKGRYTIALGLALGCSCG